MKPYTYYSNWRLYPTFSDLYINAIETIQGGVAIKLSSSKYTVILISVGGKGPQQMARMAVEFLIGDESIVRATVRGITGSGETSREYFIECSFTPARHYEKMGHTSPGWVTLRDTDIPFEPPIDPTTWTVGVNEVERVEIMAEIGNLVSGAYTDHEKAAGIMEDVLASLKGHMGTPSDAMLCLSPLMQFRTARKGEGRVHCSNLVDIVVDFCRAFGIIARRINLWQGGLLGNDDVQNIGYNIQTAEGHTTMEIYCRQSERWIWTDPMYGVKGSYYSTGDNHKIPLSLHDVIPIVNDRDRAGSLYLNLVTQSSPCSFSTWQNAPRFRNYLNPTQIINYIGGS
jgi:hypothetical protein